MEIFVKIKIFNINFASSNGDVKGDEKVNSMLCSLFAEK